MHKEIAQWLNDEIMRKGDLYQYDAAKMIKGLFGDEYVFISESGNLRINEQVLRVFNKIKGLDISYDKIDHFWHRKTDIEKELEFDFDSDFEVR